MDAAEEDFANAATELRAITIRNFLMVRRTARFAYDVAEEGRKYIRRLHRKIAQIEGGWSPIMESERLIELRRLLRAATTAADKAEDIMTDIGNELNLTLSVLDKVLSLQEALDFLNVGAAERPCLDGIDTAVDLVRFGLEDSAANGRFLDHWCPMQACINRATYPRRERNFELASTADFDAFDSNFAMYRAAVFNALAELSAIGHDERALTERGPEQLRPMLVRRTTALQLIIDLWRGIEPVLHRSGDRFTLQQKLAVLRADPAKIDGADLPEDATLLELVGGAKVENPLKDAPYGPFLVLGVTASITELHDALKLTRLALSGDEEKIAQAALAMRGSTLIAGPLTLQ